MKKLKSSLTNMLAVLTVIAIVAGGVLAFVNDSTAGTIKEIEQKNLESGLKEVLQDSSTTVQKEDIDTIYFAGKEPKEGEKPKDDNIQFIVYHTNTGLAVSTKENGFGGLLTVLVGFDDEGSIKGYKVLKHAETPGLGAKAADWFQKDGKGNIIGMNPGKNNFTVSKDGGEVDAITASTITSRAFLRAIQNAYDKVIAGQDATSGATKQADKSEGEGKTPCAEPTASDIETPEVIE